METKVTPTEVVDRSELLTKLHNQNKHWLSEINFLNDEVRFMTDLLDKFFTSLIKDEHVNRIQLIKMQLISIGFIRNNIRQDILRHQVNIEEKINNVSNKSEDFLALEDERMADEVADVSKSFKGIKREIFNITSILLHKRHLA